MVVFIVELNIRLCKFIEAVVVILTKEADLTTADITMAIIKKT